MLRRLLTDRKPHCATEQFFRLWHEADIASAVADVEMALAGDPVALRLF
jgi:hypothetical protein